MPGTSEEILEEDLELDSVFFQDKEAEPSDLFMETDAALTCLNECLDHIGEEKIDKKRIKEDSYVRKKLQDSFKNIAEKIFGLMDFGQESGNGDQCYFNKIKNAYAESTNKEVKYTLLSLLPEEWGVRRILKEFPATTAHMARKAVQLRSEGYRLRTHTVQRRTLDPEIKQIVEDFYCSDDVSRIMPGKKDYVSVRIDGKKQHLQKRLILSNIKEVYQYFKQCRPDAKIGFSKFASLRPKNCVLAGSAGTHSICVCTIHQNIKLMLEGCKISKLTANEEIQISDYKTCIALVICNPPSINCYLGSCTVCPRSSKLRGIFDRYFVTNCIDVITYYQWTCTDRSNLELRLESSSDFIDSFMSRLIPLIRHVFITEQQNLYFKHLKSSLSDHEFLVVLDFSENYTFVIQDAAQGYHWTNEQATIHPFGIYFRNRDGEIDHTNLIVISDCLKHDTVAVYIFQRSLIKFLKENFGVVKKIFYFSDGSASQYKNKKKFYNLSIHSDEYKTEAEWNFFATSHGKSVCDGLGGTVKRLATKASLQRIQGDGIKTPLQLYDWATANIRNMNFIYVTLEEYEKEKENLQDRFLGIKPVPSTRMCHQVQPVCKGTVAVKYFSSSEERFIYNLETL